jgi:hypothetical protein
MFKKIVGLLLIMGSPALALTQTPTATFTPTPTASPCTTIGPPSLSVSLRVEPVHPVVGDQVVLSFGAFAPGGIPTYSVFGGSPVLVGNPPSVHHNTFGEAVQFEVTAAQAGTAMVRLSVNFETPYGCSEDPFFSFVTLSSDPFPIEVAPMPTATPIPTSARLPTNDEGDGCSLIPQARADPSALLLALPVAWILRRGGGRSRGTRAGG